MANPGEAGPTIRTERVEGGVVVRPSGDVDLNVSPSLRQALKQVLRGRPERLVVDLSGVPYMDSSGVATLVEAMQIARKSGTRMALCSLQERVRSIFEIARLETVFAIYATPEEALRA